MITSTIRRMRAACAIRQLCIWYRLHFSGSHFTHDTDLLHFSLKLMRHFFLVELENFFSLPALIYDNLNNKPSVECIVAIFFWPHVCVWFIIHLENLAKESASFFICELPSKMLQTWFRESMTGVENEKMVIHFRNSFCSNAITTKVIHKKCSKSCDCNDAFIQVKIMLNFKTFSLKFLP